MEADILITMVDLTESRGGLMVHHDDCVDGMFSLNEGMQYISCMTFSFDPIIFFGNFMDVVGPMKHSGESSSWSSYSMMWGHDILYGEKGVCHPPSSDVSLMEWSNPYCTELLAYQSHFPQSTPWPTSKNSP